MNYMNYREVTHMDPSEMFYAIATLGVSNFAIRESARADLPGRYNGPADAYRHLLLSAELTRRFGEGFARESLISHEITGYFGGQPREQWLMDQHNNELGIQIGLAVRANGGSWRDVYREARKLIDVDSPDGDAAQWLPKVDPNNKENSWAGDPPNPVWPPKWKDGAYYNEYSGGGTDFLWDPAFWELFAVHSKELFNPAYKSLSEFGHWFGQNILVLQGIRSPVVDFYKSAYAWLQRHGVLDQKAFENLFHKAFDSRDVNDVANRVSHAKSISSPIILDFDGNGVKTTSAKSGAYFDHDGDGFAERTGWVAEGDGLLVHDINGNGRIDNGTELFGNETRKHDGLRASNGFDALEMLDLNGDGLIDAKDPVFAELKVWIDTDGDGYASDGELWNLTDTGITSISIAYRNTEIIDEQGNAHKQVGTYTRTDGSQALATDVWFAVDRTYSLAETWVDVPVEILQLPDLAGYGTARDLHQALVLDTDGTLKESVLAYIAEADEGRRHSIASEIIFQWTDVDRLDPHGRGSYVDARKLEALERLLGEDFYQADWGGNPGSTAGRKIDQAFDKLVGSIVAKLDAQVLFADLYAKIERVGGETTYIPRLDFSGVIDALRAKMNADMVEGLALLDSFARNLKALGWEGTSIWQSLADALSPASPSVIEILRIAQLDSYAGTEVGDRLVGGAGHDRLLGFSGNDVLYGQGGDDVLEGGEGQDILEGGIGNDILNGNAGSDVLDGNSGSDVYLFDSGFGSDHIHQYDSSAGSQDIARFNKWQQNDVTQVVRQGDDLTLSFDQGDSLTIDGYFDAAPRRVAFFEFADGEHWDLAVIKSRVNTLGTSEDDTFYSYTGAGNRIFGLDGNDALHGGSEGDRLVGGAGNDLLYGQSGDDVLEGGADSDTLKGGNGSDTYRFERGGGLDTIYDYQTAANEDHLRFDGDIAFDQLWFSRNESNLQISIIGTDDKITVNNWYTNSAYQIETLKSSDGKTLLSSQVQSLVDAMASFSPPAAGQLTLPDDYQSQLQPVLAANWK